MPPVQRPQTPTSRGREPSLHGAEQKRGLALSARAPAVWETNPRPPRIVEWMTKATICRRCGYDMAGLDGKPCPECGVADPLARRECLPRGAVAVMRPVVIGLLLVMIVPMLPPSWFDWISVRNGYLTAVEIAHKVGMLLWVGCLLSALYLIDMGRRRLAFAVCAILVLAGLESFSLPVLAG